MSLPAQTGSYESSLKHHYAAVRARLMRPALPRPVVTIEKPVVRIAAARPAPFRPKPVKWPAYSDPAPYDHCAGSIAPPPPVRTMKDIIADVAAATGYRPADIVSHRRPTDLCLARDLATWTIKTERPDLTLTQIARAFGRDHTSVLSSVRRQERRMREAQP